MGVEILVMMRNKGWDESEHGPASRNVNQQPHSEFIGRGSRSSLPRSFIVGLHATT
jgi:hypothetical protein